MIAGTSWDRHKRVLRARTTGQHLGFKGLEQQSDNELLCRAPRGAAKVIYAVAKVMMLNPALAATRPAEFGALAKALAECLKAARGFRRMPRSAIILSVPELIWSMSNKNKQLAPRCRRHDA